MLRLRTMVEGECPNIGGIYVCKKYETFWNLSSLWSDMFT